MVLKTILLFCLVYLVTGIIHSIFYKRAVTREAIGWLEFMQLYIQSNEEKQKAEKIASAVTTVC